MLLKREDLYKSEEYWLERIQNDIFRMVLQFQEEHKLNQTQLAKELGVSKGYVSQILNGNFNFSLTKLIELCLKLGVAPQVDLHSKLAEYMDKEEKRLFYLKSNGFVSYDFNSKGITFSINNSECLQIA
ncbi:MAG: helix-turn-helix domain-containing protein [Cytophagaceae bacterium]